MRWGNHNTETQKSEQTLFAQISVYQYYDVFDCVRCTAFQDLKYIIGPCRTFFLQYVIHFIKQKIIIIAVIF